MSSVERLASERAGVPLRLRLPGGITEQETRDQVRRLLESRLFSRCRRLSRFLEYVFETGLRGGADQLKEYAIALEVFDKPSSFDSRLDPIVRVEAGRLRAKVREYYDSHGRADALWVGLGEHGYAPVVRRRAAAGRTAESVSAFPLAHVEPVERRWHAVAVLPFKDRSPENNAEPFCAALTDQVVALLAKRPGLEVAAQSRCARSSESGTDIREVAEALRVNWILEGSVLADASRIRVIVDLVNCSSNRCEWSEVYNEPLDDVFRVQDVISAAIEGATADKLIAKKRPSRCLPRL